LNEVSGGQSPAIVEAVAPLRDTTGWLPLQAGTGPVNARLVNGVFGDPLLEVKFKSRRERLLFDLGESSKLTRRVLHTVTEVFLTHAHFDHICGFLHFLRARMTGTYPPCRIFGPPGTGRHIENLIGGIAWDRIEDAGPEFHVADIHARRIQWLRLKPGQPPVQLDPQPRSEDIVCVHPEYHVRCVQLDHGIPVLAYALNYAPEIHIDRSRLEAMGVPPADWITTLKRHLRDDEPDALIDLPNGERKTAAALRDAVIMTMPGKNLVYATDFADTAANRQRVQQLAAGADLFFCEATFCAADQAQAGDTRHLTTQACAEIAQAAGVRRLVPFHFSKRYTECVADVYTELRTVLAQRSC